MPLRDDLLQPVSAGQPAGENLRYAPVFDRIKEARRQDDDAPQGEWTRERKLADWPLTIQLIAETLATRSKDLQLVAWLAEAMLIREGVSGLREVLDLARGLLESFWEGLYRELEEGDAELRATPLHWIGERLEIPLKQSPLTRKGLNWFQYKESRAVGTEAAADTDARREARARAIAEGKLTQEDFDADFDAAPKQFYVDLLAAYDAALASLDALSSLCDAKFGDAAPSFSRLKASLEEIGGPVKTLLQRKREKEPDALVAGPALKGAPEPEAGEPEPQPAAEGGASAAPARARDRAPGPAAEPMDREDAIARVVAAAQFLRGQDACSPVPYLLLRGLRWGELRSAAGEIDQALLAAPSTEIRQNLRTLALDANWSEVLRAAEAAMGLECGRGWLDLQRYVARACYELGSYYEPIRGGVISALRALLADYPGLAAMTLMDDTPTANQETQAWLQTEVLPPPAEAMAEPPPAIPPPAVWESVETGPDVFESAAGEARAGRPQQAIGMLMRQMAQEGSGRARFQRKAQLAQLCVMTGHTPVALPILQDLAGEIERRRLEDWEAAATLVGPLALLYSCLDQNGGAEERQKLYSWICRLDPVRALTVSK